MLSGELFGGHQLSLSGCFTLLSRNFLHQSKQKVQSEELTQQITSGCVVHHHPTDEDWLVLGVNGDKICVAGWPPTIAEIKDCTLLPQPPMVWSEKDLKYRDETFGSGWI